MPGGTFRIANYGDGGTTAWRDWFLINSPWQLPAAEPPAPLRLADEIPGALERARTLDDEAIGASSPALAIASSRHETQYTRLFRS